MSEIDEDQASKFSQKPGHKKRRFLSPEKKYQLFLEAQRGEIPVGELLRREGLYSTDLARIQRKVKEGALERLADRPGRWIEYDPVYERMFKEMATTVDREAQEEKIREMLRYVYD